jgi:large subunit ribosomal protein L13
MEDHVGASHTGVGMQGSLIATSSSRARTYSPKIGDVRREWIVVDAESWASGRLAAQVARLLMGKHKPTYTRHLDTGDHVIVVNTSRLELSRTRAAEVHHWHTGYPGGLKSRANDQELAKDPAAYFRRQVKGMLPKGPLGRQMMRKLKVYAGPGHPHQAQQPRFPRPGELTSSPRLPTAASPTRLAESSVGIHPTDSSDRHTDGMPPSAPAVTLFEIDGWPAVHRRRKGGISSVERHGDRVSIVFPSDATARGLLAWLIQAKNEPTSVEVDDSEGNIWEVSPPALMRSFDEILRVSFFRAEWPTESWLWLDGGDVIHLGWVFRATDGSLASFIEVADRWGDLRARQLMPDVLRDLEGCLDSSH